MNLAHLHLLLNHFPIIGTAIAVGLLLIALAAKSDDLKRASLAVFFGLALLALPAYMSGNGAQMMLTGREGVSDALMNAHQEAALLALIFMEITGVVAWFGLWQYRRNSRPAAWNIPAVLVLSILSFGLMARAGNTGGEVRHPEAFAAVQGETGETASEAAPPYSGPEFLKGANIATFALNSDWVWPASEAIHFIGLGLLFGAVLVINLRMLGMMKSISFSTLHGLLPLGIVGFVVNSLTGMLFFIATPDQYVMNIAFFWKIALILLAGVNVLYHTLLDEPWNLGAGQDAPLTTKVFAGSSLVLWFGVIYFGRMLPFIGNSF